MISKRIIWRYGTGGAEIVETVTDGAETESPPLPAPNFDCSVPAVAATAAPLVEECTVLGTLA